jgi:predicted O-methyltransferase YrrM
MDSYLPEMKGLSKGIRKGRNVYEGYQRGWGLQFGQLRQKVLEDPLYNEALSLVKQRTILAEYSRMNIYLILRFFLKNVDHGHVIEFGSYKGGNAIFMAYVVDKLYPGMKVYALDSFEGMPATDKSVDAHNAGDFKDADYIALGKYIDDKKIRNLELVKGYFEDTAEDVLKRAGKISLAHIDCDVLPSVKVSYEVVKPYMVSGGYIVFDDATVSSCIGATEAVEDIVVRRDGLNSEQIFPHFVFRTF